MTDTDRLAALLHEEYEDIVGVGPCGTCAGRAARLIAAGVTLAPTPPDALREAAQAVVDLYDDSDPAGYYNDGASMQALRAALRETP